MPLPLTCSPSTTGKVESDGNVHITLCDFIEPWETTSATQKKALTQRYAMGCDCKVKLKGIQKLKVELELITNENNLERCRA